MLTAMQAQTDSSGELVAVDSSACLTTFDEFTAEISTRNLNDLTAAKAAYEQMRSDKGAQGTSDMGFWMSFYGEYQSTIVAGFNFYNECSLDYYMMAIGANVQNPTGLANLIIAMGFQIYKDPTSGTLAELATNMALWLADTSVDANAELAGQSTGTFFQELLAVAIPTATDSKKAYYQPASSF